MKSKLLITGGFGFIGRNLIERLYEEYEIIVIDKNIDTCFAEKFRIKAYSIDLINSNLLNNIIQHENPEYVINLVSLVTAARDLNLLNDMLASNMLVLSNLYQCLKYSSDLKLFIHFGTGEEYGNIKPPFKETDRESPNSPYSIAKQAATNFAIMLYNNYHFPITVVRPSNIFGKYQAKDKFIPYIIDKLINDKEIITTRCEQKRDFINIKALCRRIELLLRSKNAVGEIFNISSGVSYELKEIIEYLKSRFYSETNVKYGAISYRDNEIMDFMLDNTKFNKKIKNDSSDFWNDLSTFIEDYKESKL